MKVVKEWEPLDGSRAPEYTVQYFNANTGQWQSLVAATFDEYSFAASYAAEYRALAPRERVRIVES